MTHNIDLIIAKKFDALLVGDKNAEIRVGLPELKQTEVDVMNEFMTLGGIELLEDKSLHQLQLTTIYRC